MEHASPATDTTSRQLTSSSVSETAKSDAPQVTIAVMGATGSGKSTFINLASNSDLRIGNGLHSCTSVVQMAQPFNLNGREVVLIDTPGFDDTTKSDADILRMIAAFLSVTYNNGMTLAGVIYLHRISDPRVGGTSTRNFKMFRQLCGESTLKNIIIVTTWWSDVSQDVGIAREAELASDDLFFKPVLDEGAQMLRHENTPTSAHEILSHIIDNHPLPLQIQRELVDEKMDIADTAAGMELNRELNIQLEKQRQEMRRLKEDMEEAIREKDEKTKAELEAATRKLQEAMTKVQNDSQNLASKFEEEKKQFETTLREARETALQEAEKRNATHNEQMRTQGSSRRRQEYLIAFGTILVGGLIQYLTHSKGRDELAQAGAREAQLRDHIAQIENDRQKMSLRLDEIQHQRPNNPGAQFFGLGL